MRRVGCNHRAKSYHASVSFAPKWASDSPSLGIRAKRALWWRHIRATAIAAAGQRRANETRTDAPRNAR